MPTVTLSGYECANDLLPPVCAACGRPATDRVPLTFTWHPKWAEPLFVVAWLFIRRMGVRMPLCARHAWRWRWNNILIVAAFIPGAGLIGGAYVYDLGQPPGFADELVMLGLLCSGGVVLLVGAMFAKGLSERIRPTEITDRHLTLDHVHETFVAALAEDRAESTDPLRAEGYGDSRDDYDDRPPDAV
jgi:hypothetical protein